MNDPEVMEGFVTHMNSILENDRDTYRKTVAEDLTLYEWWVVPHRLDGIPFHEFMMDTSERQGSVFGVDGEPGGTIRFDYSNLKIQRYGNTAIISYTLLISTTKKDGVQVVSHNESRVMIKMDGIWKVVHVHKSPDWNTPHTPPIDR